MGIAETARMIPNRHSMVRVQDAFSVAYPFCNGPRYRTRLSFVLTAIFRNFLFALMKPLRYRRSPRYQHGLICKALRKVSVILLHDIESRLLGELSMILGK